MGPSRGKWGLLPPRVPGWGVGRLCHSLSFQPFRQKVPLQPHWVLAELTVVSARGGARWDTCSLSSHCASGSPRVDTVPRRGLCRRQAVFLGLYGDPAAGEGALSRGAQGQKVSDAGVS